MKKFKSLTCILVIILIVNLLFPQLILAVPGAAVSNNGQQSWRESNPAIRDAYQRVPDYKDGDVLFKVKGGIQEENRLIRKYGMKLSQRVPRTGYVLASVKSKNFAETVRRLQKEGSVVHAQPNYIYRTFGLPNDPQFTRQWALKNINGYKTWNSVTTGKDTPVIIVAVLDTGVDVNHPDLKTRLVSGTNTVNPLKSSRDNDGHGTHIAGIISALTNNMTGVAGVTGTAQVKVMPIKVFDGDQGSDVTISNGIIWAVDHGARVINMSFGSYSKSEVLNEAIDYAYQKGVVLVAAAGNWASEEVSYPAAVSRVMAVSAINSNDKITDFSSFGSLIDICAPGEEIYSTYWDSYKGSTYTEMSGTSMASPMVAGLAALLFVKNPKLTNDEIRQIIEVSAADLGDPGWDPEYGHGKINVDKAMAISLSRIDDSNGSLRKAVSLKNGVPFKEKIHFGSDQDWFKIDVPQKGHLQVEVLPAGKVSPGVEVYDNDGKLLASFNSGSQPEKMGTNDSLLGESNGGQSALNPVQFKVAEAVYGLAANLNEGDYYIKVFGNHYRWSDREYTVTARVIAGAGLTNDVNEPNNSPKSARSITIGSQVSGTISSQWDQDWFKVELPGTIYQVQAKTPAGLDLAIEIESEENYQDSSGEEDFEDYYAGWFYQSINKSGIGGNEEGTIVLPQSGNRFYLLRVYDAGGGAYNGSYTITVSPYDLKPDKFEPNNSLNAAAPLKTGQTVTGNFDKAKDSDWFCVEIDNTGILEMDFRRPDNVWCDINIYRDNIENPVRNNFMGFTHGLGAVFGGNFGTSDVIESEFKVFPGKYYIQISSLGKMISGKYEFKCEFSSFNFVDAEINDFRSGAVKLNLGEVKQGTIYPTNDLDGYELNIDKAEPLLVTVTPGKEIDTSTVIMFGSGKEPNRSEKGIVVTANLANSPESEESELDVVTTIDSGKKGQVDTSVFHPSKPGRYYLFISGSGKAGSKYSINVRPFELHSDKWEDNETLKKAKPVLPGNSISPTFMGTEDIDWFKVYIPGAGVFSANMSVPHDIDGVLEIYDNSGKLLTKSDQSMVGEKENVIISLRSKGYYYIKTFDYLGNSSVQAYTLTTGFTAAKQIKPAAALKKVKHKSSGG